MSIRIGIGLGIIPTAARPSATTSPVNQVKPFFAGILTQGQSANANPGSWTGLPAANFTYVIKRGATTVSTDPAYVWTSADVAAGAGAMTVEVTATNDIGPTTATSDPVTIAALLQLSGTPGAAVVGSPYSFIPTRTGGHGGFTYALAGTLLSGMTFSTTTGAISGTPVASGTASLTIGVIDADGLTASLGPFNLVASSPSEEVKAIPLLAGSTYLAIPDDFVAFRGARANGPSGRAAAGVTNTRTGGGGGGGAFAGIATGDLPNAQPGDVLLAQVGLAGSGQATLLKDNTGATVLLAPAGGDATGATGGLGGKAADAIGRVKRSGGDGGAGATNTGSRGGGGGGGAGSENGDGVAGLGGATTSAGRAGGASGSGLVGGAGGGAGAAGQPGASGTELDASRGSGSGGGGGGSSASGVGGAGGRYGGGPGGGGSSASQGAQPGSPSDGILWFEYLSSTASGGPTAYDIILIAGQSNAAGRGESSVADVDDPKVMQFGGNTADVASYQKMVSTNFPLWHPEPELANWRGPGATLGSAYAAGLTAGRQVLLVPVAWGSSTLIGGGWAPGGTQREFAVAQANAAVAAAKAINPASRLVGILWVQGETDGENGVSTAAYLAAFNSMLADFRSRITGGPAAWCVVGSLVPEAITWAGHAGYPAIDIAHMRAVLANTNIAFAQGPFGKNRGDRLHYNRAGAIDLGNAARSALSRLAKPSVTYDFERDDPALASAIGLTDASINAAPVVASAAHTGITGKYLTASGFPNAGATPGADAFQVILEAADPAVADQVVEFTRSYSAAAHGRDGITLRVQAGQSVVGGDQWGRIGYLFDIDGTSGTAIQVRIYRLEAGAKVFLNTATNLSLLAGRRFRASAIGSTLKLEYSDDAGATWTQAGGTVTDATYTSGAAAYGQFKGTTAGSIVADQITVRHVI